MPISSHDFEGMKPLAGGVGVAVTRMNGSDLVHGVVLGEALSYSLEEEAKCHHAFFDHQGINNVIELDVPFNFQPFFLNGQAKSFSIIPQCMRKTLVFLRKFLVLSETRL